MNLKGTKKKNQVSNVNIFEQQELLKKIEVVRENLTASTWRELETKGKFDKNAKLSFICDDMLILGCDVGSETHYLRAIDTRGRELSKSAFSFSNNADKITPNTGFIKPNTATFETGLYFNRIPHREYAAAETSAR